MSNDDLTDLMNVGPHRAELLREAGFESADEVRGAPTEDLEEIDGVGAKVASAIKSGEKIYGNDSKFDDVREALIEGAKVAQTKTGIARDAGITRPTLRKYLEEHPEFAREFRAARGATERELIIRALEDDPDVDTQFVKFLLERSYSYNKEQDINIDADNTHRLEGDGFQVEFNDDA